MPKEKIINLISDLHSTFGDDLTSDQQKKLLEKIKENAHTLGEKSEDTTILDTANLLLEEISDDHPKAAATVRQLIKVLGDMGI